MNISAEYKNRESMAARKLSDLRANGDADSGTKPLAGKPASMSGQGKPDSDTSHSKSMIMF